MGETHTLEAFREKFRVAELLVLDVGVWSWSVRPSQPTLGAGIISLNRYALKLSEVSAEEMADLAGLVRKLEGAVQTCFDHRIMNYLMLMMVDHQVHYHVIPRYEGERHFQGLRWVDNGWPKLAVLSDSQHEDAVEILPAIRDALIAALAPS